MSKWIAKAVVCYLRLRKRLNYPSSPALQRDYDVYYLENYLRAYTTERYAAANCQIPQIRVWDGYDIIRGYGSFTEEVMSCAVFRGIGSIAFRYYLLFQHHLPPPSPPPHDFNATIDDSDKGGEQ
jgi:hypothetical protein